MLGQERTERWWTEAENMKRRKRRGKVHNPISPPQFLIKVADSKVKTSLVRHIHEHRAAPAQDPRNLTDGFSGVVEVLEHGAQHHDVERRVRKAALLHRLTQDPNARVIFSVVRKVRGWFDTDDSPAVLLGRQQQLASTGPNVEQSSSASRQFPPSLQECQRRLPFRIDAVMFKVVIRGLRVMLPESAEGYGHRVGKNQTTPAAPPDLTLDSQVLSMSCSAATPQPLRRRYVTNRTELSKPAITVSVAHIKVMRRG